MGEAFFVPFFLGVIIGYITVRLADWFSGR